MGGLLDRIESFSPQGKTYSVVSRSNPDPAAGTESARQNRQWGRDVRDTRQILSLSALAYRLAVQGEWESLIGGRSTLALSKHNYGFEDEYTVTIHRDDLSLELGAILLPRVKVVKADNTSVYWEDTLGAVWGVRFLTEGDTLRFLAGCSPPVLTPDRHHDTADVRWVPSLPLFEEETSDSPVQANILRKKNNVVDASDALDSSFRFSPGWKEGDLLKAVVEGFHSRKLSLELQSLEALSFTQLTGELTQNLDSDLHTEVPPDSPNTGDRESKISQRSLSDDVIALHDSIDHFTQAFVSDSTTDVANDNRNTTDVANDNRNTTDVANDNGNTTDVANDNRNTTDVANDNGNTTDVANDNGNTTDEVTESRHSNEFRWVYPHSAPGEDGLMLEGENGEEVLEPVFVELEEGGAGGVGADTDELHTETRDITKEFRDDLVALDDAVRKLEMVSKVRPSLPGSRRSSLLIQQERLIISPDKLRASLFSEEERGDLSLALSEPSALPPESHVGRYASLPAMHFSELETSSDISLSHPHYPDNIIGASKSGWLEVSKLLSHKKRKLHLSTRHKWKRCWCSVKGASLVLHSRENSSLLEQARADPILCLDLEGCIVQTAYECIKRNHVFSLSLSNGRAFYLQAITQGEVKKWMNHLHCSAAVACTRQLNRQLAVEKLRMRLLQLESEIEADMKIKNKAEIKLEATEDLSVREVIKRELASLDLCAELLQAELYRTKCYISSLSNIDLPNHDSFLAALSTSTKQSLSKLGRFTASTAYAFICDKNTSGIQYVLKNSLLNAFREQNTRLSEVQTPAKRQRLIQVLELLQSTSSDLSLTVTSTSTTQIEGHPARSSLLRKDKSFHLEPRRLIPGPVDIRYPDGEIAKISIEHSSAILDVLLNTCINRNLDPQDYYIQLKLDSSDQLTEYKTPPERDLLRDHAFSSLELCSKASHIIDLYPVDEVPLGFSVEVVEKNIYGKFIPSFVVTQVETGGQADIFCMAQGDELTHINNTSTQSLSLEDVCSLLKQNSVRIEFRTKQRKLPYSFEEIELINTLICPAPPPSTSRLSTQEIRPLVIPNPKHFSFMSVRELAVKEEPGEVSEERDLLQTLVTESQALNYSVRLWDLGFSLEQGAPPRADRLTQCCNELVLTEKEFVASLDLLVTRYLEPLQHETFMSEAEISLLYESTKQVLVRQNEFFSQLEIHLNSEGLQSSNAVLEISTLFTRYSHSFRQFSIFCTSYRNAQELINTRTEEVQVFLGARNPHNKNELRFDSLLALPIQRILRYPLFLRNMRDCVCKGSEEYREISNAIQTMDRVAGYIDEIQYMSEKFASLFNGILVGSGLRNVGVHVDIAEMMHRFDAIWLNPTEERGKRKKGEGPGMTLFLFPRVLIVISYDNKFNLKLSKHGIVDYRDVEDLLSYKLALLLFYCSLKDFPDSDGVRNMVQIRSEGIEQKVNLILKCKARPEKAKLIREFKFAIEQVKSVQKN